MRQIVDRESLERALIEVGLGFVLGNPEYYFPYNSRFGQLAWARRVGELTEAWRNF